MNKYIWMMVTTDKYEFPIEVAESAGKLAELVGSSRGSIISSVHKLEHGVIKKSRYRRVVDDEGQ